MTGVANRKSPARSRKTPNREASRSRRLPLPPRKAGAAALAAAPGDRELLFAICHEVGNLLAASRLTAHLLTREAADPEHAASSRTIEDLASQAGSLLAHVRILLAGGSTSRVRIASRDLLDAIARPQSRRFDGAGLRVASRRSAPLAVEADPDAVHQALSALVDSALEAAGAHGSVQVHAERVGEQAGFVVRDDGPPFDESAETATLRRGRHLVLELARAVAKRQGGSLHVRRLRRGTEVRLLLPCARESAPRRSPAPGAGRTVTRPRAPAPPSGGS